MRKVAVLAWSVIRQRLGSPVAWIFFLLLPLVFTGAISVGLRGLGMGAQEAPQEASFTLYVVQHDAGPVVDAFLAALRETNVVVRLVETLPDESFGLVFPEGFSQGLMAGNVETVTLHTLPTQESTAVEQAVAAAQGRVGGAVLIARQGVTHALTTGLVKGEEETQALFEKLLQDALTLAAHPNVTTSVVWPAGVQVRGSALATNTEQASAGQLITWVQTTVLGVAQVLIMERRSGTLRRLLVQPLSRSVVLVGKLIGWLSLGLLQMALLLLGGWFLFGVAWGHHPIAVALVSFSFAASTVALGLLLATVARTERQASSIALTLSLALSALGGAWWPLEITPPLYQKLALLLPTAWAMRAYTDVLVRDVSVLEVLPTCGVLLGSAAVFVALGAWRFRHWQT